MICPRCQTINPHHAAFCLDCGFKLELLKDSPALAPTVASKGLATASLVLGAISLITCSLLGVGAFAGMGLGIAALVNANSDPREYGGKRMAFGGIALSVLSLFAGVYMVSTVIPSITNSRIEANELAAVDSIERAGFAETKFLESRNRFGTLEELHEAGLIDKYYFERVNRQNGYRVEVRVKPGSFEVSATPLSYGESGRRSFYMTSDYEVHAADKQGLAADASDPFYDY
jgi:hypothetical protein